MSAKVIRCFRCDRRCRNDRGDWNVEFKNGVPVAVICPTCQTPEENAEAEIRYATLDYGVDATGRAIARPKGIA